jgi:TPP-dependent trihydroxycyclohexane-1,2-dione (THcHDO) dehydratase
MVTAAAVTPVDRLPVLLLAGGVFASRRPNAAVGEGLWRRHISANDITRPERSSVHRGRGLSVRAGDASIVPGRTGGGGCIDRLQRAPGGVAFNNLLADCGARQSVNFRAHATSLGALAEQSDGIADLEAALQRAVAATHTSVVVLRTDPRIATAAGGHWWDVGVPEVSTRPEVNVARAD